MRHFSVAITGEGEDVGSTRQQRMYLREEQRPPHAHETTSDTTATTPREARTKGARVPRPRPATPANHTSRSKSVGIAGHSAVTHSIENALVSRQPPSWQEPPCPWADGAIARSEKPSSGRVRAGRERYSPQGREEQSRRAPHRCR